MKGETERLECIRLTRSEREEKKTHTHTHTYMIYERGRERERAKGGENECVREREKVRNNNRRLVDAVARVVCAKRKHVDFSRETGNSQSLCCFKASVY